MSDRVLYSTDPGIDRIMDKYLDNMEQFPPDGAWNGNGNGSRRDGGGSRRDGPSPMWNDVPPERGTCDNPKPRIGAAWATPLVQFPFPGMVMDTTTGVMRWERPGDHLQYRPVSQWGIDQKLLTAFQYSLRHLDRSMRDQLLQLFSTENLPYFSGALSLWAASHFFGVDEVVDVAL